MKPLIGCIIQARLTSTRFPKKILADFFGKTVLETVVERCYEAKLVDKIVIAAPHQLGVCLNEELFIGSEHDVLDRYYQCAKKYGFTVIVRITSDCPLIEPYEIDRCINRLLERDTHYVTNRPATFDGNDVEVFTFHALQEAWGHAESLEDREHVTPYMKRDFSLNPISLEAPKLSLDTAQDLERMKAYYESQRKTYTNHRRDGEFCSEFPTTYSSVQQA